MKKALLLLATTALMLTGCIEQANPEAAKPLIEQHLPEQVYLQSLQIKAKNLEVSLSKGAMSLSPGTEGQFIKKFHDELLRTFGNDQITSVTYRVEGKTARTINGLSCKRVNGCWEPFLNQPLDNPLLIDRYDSPETIDDLIEQSNTIVAANYSDETYRVTDLFKGDPALLHQTFKITDDIYRDYATNGRYLLFLHETPSHSFQITGVWSGKFKLEGRPKGYGDDPVRAVVEAMTDQQLIELIRNKIKKKT